jgi:hypothetical protein
MQEQLANIVHGFYSHQVIHILHLYRNNFASAA